MTDKRPDLVARKCRFCGIDLNKLPPQANGYIHQTGECNQFSQTADPVAEQTTRYESAMPTLAEQTSGECNPFNCKKCGTVLDMVLGAPCGTKSVYCPKCDPDPLAERKPAPLPQAAVSGTLHSLIAKWRAGNVNYCGEHGSTDVSYDATKLQCASELEAALAAQSPEPTQREQYEKLIATALGDSPEPPAAGRLCMEHFAEEIDDPREVAEMDKALTAAGIPPEPSPARPPVETEAKIGESR